jgi:hypothetical protein
MITSHGDGLQIENGERSIEYNSEHCNQTAKQVVVEQQQVVVEQQQVVVEQQQIMETGSYTAPSMQSVGKAASPEAGISPKDLQAIAYLRCFSYCLLLPFLVFLAIAALGIALLVAQTSLNKRMISKYGCEKYYDALDNMHCKFIPASGYGYINPNAMNITTLLPSGCLVIQPHIQDADNRTDFFAIVQYNPILNVSITLNEFTRTNFSETSRYYKYQVNQTVPCYIDPKRIDLVSYYPYTFPNPVFGNALFQSGIIVVTIGTLIAAILLITIITICCKIRKTQICNDKDCCCYDNTVSTRGDFGCGGYSSTDCNDLDCNGLDCNGLDCNGCNC